MNYDPPERRNDAVYRAHKGDEVGHGAQIVFIHGLQVQKNKDDNAFLETWLSEDGSELWPKLWLSEAFPTASIYLVRYDSCTWQDEKRGRTDMYATAENILANLILEKIGRSPRNPVILIGQDVGGLVIKEICIQASSGAIMGLKNVVAYQRQMFLKQVRGIFYFCTPHGGLDLQESQGELTKTLAVHNAANARANEAFRILRGKYEWRTCGVGASIQDEIDVKEGSARYDVDEFCMMNASTMSICRPKDTKASSFLQLTKFIEETISGFTNPHKPKLFFGSDPRYVPLQQTLKEIQSRLIDSNIQVVVLCGNAGTGKSSLAKYLALQYHEETGSSCTFRDGVFYFDRICGQGATAILKNMLLELRVDETIISTNNERVLRGLLTERLQSLSALLILDDVGEEERFLVERLVVSTAKKVKYLLTSQQSGVWRGLEYSICQIQKVSLCTAQEIIARRVGFQDNKIPEADKGIVNEIIEATDFHPLALATISTAVRVSGDGCVSVDPNEWVDMKRNLLIYLSKDEEARAAAFGDSYPRSVFLSMMYAVERLQDECLQLLCIMALFENPLPGTLVYMFMFCIQPNVVKDVNRIMKTLEGLQLVEKGAQFTSLTYGITEPWPFSALLPCSLKMHSLRQQFILTCAEGTINHPVFEKSVGAIKRTLATFLSGTYVGGSCEFKNPKGNLDTAALATVLCALYGVAQVKRSALKKFAALEVRSPFGTAPFDCGEEICVVLTGPERNTANSSTPFALRMGRSSYFLTLLMSGVSADSTLLEEGILSALQKVVHEFAFHGQIDDDSISFLISRGYYLVVDFILHHALSLDCVGVKELTCSLPKSLVAAINSLDTLLVPPYPERQLEKVLLFLQHFAITSGQTNVAPSIAPLLETPDLKLDVLVAVIHKLHVNCECGKRGHELLKVLIRILGLWAFNPYPNNIPQLDFVLRTSPGTPQVIMSILEKLVAELVMDADQFLDLMGHEYLSMSLSEIRQSTSGAERQWALYQLVSQKLFDVKAAFMALKILHQLQTIGEGEAADIITSISKPLEAIALIFAKNRWDGKMSDSALEVFFLASRFKDRRGRSTFSFVTIPGAIEGIFSLVRKIGQQSGLAVLALRCLQNYFALGPTDDSIRSTLLSIQDFFVVLVGVIDGDGQVADPDALEPALAILQNCVTSDEAAGSCLDAVPHVFEVLSHLLTRPLTPNIHHAALTVLLWLGYRIEVGGDLGSSIALQVTTHKYSLLTSGESRAVKTQNAFESLFDIIGNNRHRVAQVAALDLLLHIYDTCEYSSRIRTMPRLLAELAPLLSACDDAEVQRRAVQAIVNLPLALSHETKRLVLEVALMPGALERIVEFMTCKGAVEFLHTYLLYEPDNASRVAALPGAVEGLISVIQGKQIHIGSSNLDRLRIDFLLLLRFMQSHRACSELLRMNGAVETLVRVFHGKWPSEIRRLSIRILVESSTRVKGIISRMMGVRDVIQDMINSLQNKDQNVEAIEDILTFLFLVCQDRSSILNMVSIRGSVEAVAELLVHIRHRQVEKPDYAFQLVECEDHGRKQLASLDLTGKCVVLLLTFAENSEEAISRIVATAGFLELTTDFLDEEHNEDTQVMALRFLLVLVKSPAQAKALARITKQPDFLLKFSRLLHSSEHERAKLASMRFLFLLASVGWYAAPEKMIKLVSDVLQGFADQLENTNEAPRVLKFLGLLLSECEVACSFLLRTGALEILLFLSVHHGLESARTTSLAILTRFCATVFNGHERAWEAYLVKILKALPDILDQLGEQVDPNLTYFLLELLRCCQDSSPRILKHPGALENLISLSTSDNKGALPAIHILSHLCHISFQDKSFKACLLKVVDALPTILDQLDRHDSVALQASVIRLLRLLMVTGVCYNDHPTRAYVWSRLICIVLYNPKVLQLMVALLHIDKPKTIHKDAMIVLRYAASDTPQGMLQIMQIPGTLERIAELVCRGNDDEINSDAFCFLHNLIANGKVRAGVPPYVLECLARVVSTNVNWDVSSEALRLLQLCAEQNKNALHHLIHILHRSTRLTLRAEAVNFLINQVSGHYEPGKQTLLPSLQSLVHGLQRDECSLQVKVLQTLVILVESSSQSQMRMAKILTGVYAHELHIHENASGAAEVHGEKSGSMNTTVDDDLDLDLDSLVQDLHQASLDVIDFGDYMRRNCLSASEHS